MSLISIDTSSAIEFKRTGVQWYARYLIQNMMRHPLLSDERVVLYSPSYLDNDFGVLTTGWKNKRLRWPLKKGWMQGRVSLEMLIHAPDLLFVPSKALPRILPKKTITTIHDVAFARRPDLYSADEYRHLESVTRDVAMRADKILVTSEFTKDELINRYQVSNERISITPLAVSDEYQQLKKTEIQIILTHLGINYPFFLFVGRQEKKKNIATLFKAFSQFKALPGNGKFQLVTVGPSSKFGYLSVQEIVALMNAATALVFPSWEEGFGLPILEAMACGCPVLASDIPVHREVAGKAAWLIDPIRTDKWTEAMNVLAHTSSEVDQYKKAGLQQVKNFSWQKTAEKTWKAIRSLL